MNYTRLSLAVIASGILIDLLSITAWVDPRLAAPIMGVVLLIVAYASFRNLSLGVAIVLIELLWGSHGRLFASSFGGVSVSLRMGIFVVVLVATCWELRKQSTRNDIRIAFQTHPARVPFVLLALTFGIGIVLGIARNPLSIVFQDANAWIFFALLPTFLIVARRGGRVMMEALIFAAAAYLILRFLALLFVFSHDTGDLALAMYKWVRDTRLGEVTFFANGFPRVFLPSIALLFPIIGLAIARMLSAQRVRAPYAALIGGAVAVIIASFSRSFWLGGIAALAVFVCVQIKRHTSITVHTGLLPNVIPTARHDVRPESLRRILTPFGSGALRPRSGSASEHPPSLLGTKQFVPCNAPALLGTPAIRTQRFRLEPRVARDGSAFGNRPYMRRVIIASVISILIGVGFIAALVRFPFPPSLMESGLSRAIVDRFAITGEAAVSNRQQELSPLSQAIGHHAFFGNGFGTTVTYNTLDPRTLADHPDGRYTTYAFEWGYLDHILETGLFGFGALIYFLVACIVIGWRRGGTSAALAIGLVAIAVAHITSPYLNHPIGIGAMLWLAATLSTSDTNIESLNGAELKNPS